MKIKLETEVYEEMWKPGLCEVCPFSETLYSMYTEAGISICVLRYKAEHCPAKIVEE